MRIDCYGNETKSETLVKNAPARPLETKQSGDWTFMRFTEGDRVVIHKLGVGADGIVDETWACGKWADAETLSYIPITQTMEVTA